MKNKTLALAVAFVMVLGIATFPVSATTSGKVGLSIEANEKQQLTYRNSDVDGDSIVDREDMRRLFQSWGSCPDCPEDLDRNGVVGMPELRRMMLSWSDDRPPLDVPGLTIAERSRIRMALQENQVTVTPSPIRFGQASIERPFIIRSSVTSDEVADSIGVSPEIVAQDIEKIKPQADEDSLSFPTQLLLFKAVADSDDIGLVRGYIGSLKQARIVDDDIKTGEIEYRGRIVLEIAGQEQVESYLITDGDEANNIYGLVPTEGKMDGEPTAKLLLRPRTQTAMLSFTDDRGVVALDIISLERRPLKPDTSENSIDLLAQGEEIKKDDIIEEKVLETITEGPDSPAADTQDPEDQGFINWFRRLIGLEE